MKDVEDIETPHEVADLTTQISLDLNETNVDVGAMDESTNYLKGSRLVLVVTAYVFL